uniref:Dehydrogenase/reductase SDR family member 12 n=1 Tax=Magallana gigas TaxID=29159 RepID=A0A8W8IS80_MAGGI
MSIYRSGVWFVKGLREYTKSGFQSASKNFNNADLEVNVNDRAFMITGANSGIGKCAAITIAQKGGIVHMVCRDVTRGEEARQEIITQTGNQDVHLHQLDMSKPRDIFKFAKSFRESGMCPAYDPARPNRQPVQGMNFHVKTIVP